MSTTTTGRANANARVPGAVICALVSPFHGPQTLRNFYDYFRMPSLTDGVLEFWKREQRGVLRVLVPLPVVGRAS